MTPLDPNLLAALPADLGDAFSARAELWSDRLAIVDRDGRWTYGHLLAGVAAGLHWLAARRIRAGDRVMIVSENCRAAVALFFAAVKLGALPVMVNPRLSGPEVDAIRVHSGARRVVYVANPSPQTRDHASRCEAAFEDIPGLGQLAAGSVSVENIKTPPCGDDADPTAALVYTSGSTGRPKGVMLTHGNLLFVAVVSGAIRALSPEDRFYGVLPISHIVGLSVVTLGALLHGASLYLSDRFNPAHTLESLERNRLTIMLGTPAMFALIGEYCARKGIAAISAPGLRILSSSGAPLNPELKAATEELFGLPLHNGYGITECSPTIAQVRPENPRSDCSVGPALPGVETRLVGLKNETVAPGEVGELWVRGPNVMKGYYKDVDETAAVLTPEGWFNTRDLARFDDGNLFIVGRTRDLVIRFGFNVYPAEIEAVLNAHCAVRQSAVVGRAAAQGAGVEDIAAFVELHPGSTVSVPDLREHLAEHLAPYKIPSEIIFLASLPTTAGGKILKGDLGSLMAPPNISERDSVPIDVAQIAAVKLKI